MEEFELDYDVQEVRLSEKHMFKVTTIANEALPLEMLLDLETRREEISGQRLWEGSLLLCAYLVEVGQGLDLKGRAVLELGAGTGVVSMLAHSLGASPVVMTDGDEKCVLMAQKNVQENDIPAEEAFVTVLRWGDDKSTTAFCDAFSCWRTRRHTATDEAGGKHGDATAVAGEGTASQAVGDDCIPRWSNALGRHAADCLQETREAIVEPPRRAPLRSFDVILAGDVLYKRSLLAPFLETVCQMLAPGGRMLLCHVPRAGVTYDVVEEAFAEAGFGFQVLDGKKWAKGEEGERDGEGNTSTDVGGVELCADDARRARLYSVTRKEL